MHIRPARAPVLMLTLGLSGSGKTTGSAPLLEAIGAIRVRSDVERKRLAGLPELARTGSHLRAGLYSSERTRATHERLRNAAKCALEGGFNVILDATFLQREQRNQARELARGMGARFVILDFQASEETLRQRILARQRGAGDASGAACASRRAARASRPSRPSGALGIALRLYWLAGRSARRNTPASA